MTVNAGQEEIIFLTYSALDAGNHARSVSIADFVRNHADGERATFAQRACKKIGPVVKFPRSSNDALARLFRNMPGRRRVVQDRGNRSGRKAHMGGHRFERDHAFLARLLVPDHLMAAHEPQPATLNGCSPKRFIIYKRARKLSGWNHISRHLQPKNASSVTVAFAFERDLAAEHAIDDDEIHKSEQHAKAPPDQADAQSVRAGQ